MGTFKAKIKNKEGEVYEETLEASDRFAVYHEVRERGETIVAVNEVKKRKNFSLAGADRFLSSISTDEKIMLTRNLAAMLEAGLTTSRALDVMNRQSNNPRLKEVVSRISADVQKGEQLSAALERHSNVFSPIVISMVRAGEESGQLSESLATVSGQMERSHALSKKIRGAMMYPSIVLVVMVCIGILMLIYVVPTLTETFGELGTELPPTTQAIIFISRFLVEYTLISLVLIALVPAVFLYAKSTRRGKRFFNFILLRTPVIRGLIKEINSARTTRTLSSLLSSGVDMVLAISITKDVVQNSYYQEVLSEAEQVITKGGNLSDVFNKYPHLYPPLVPEMVAVGEETGRLSKMLAETARFYESSVEQQTKDLSTIVEPLLMVVVGAFVGFFALSMIIPIYSLSGSI